LILYEYPLNERIRTLLRLEDLFTRFDHFSGQPGALEHHVALTTLFEILEVASRADLKSDLLQELERQRQTLLAFRDNPNVSLPALEAVLADVDRAAQTLNAGTGKTGQHLRDNEWLMSIRSRAIIAGGTCEFDLPSYYAWQQHPAPQRRADLEGWMSSLVPLAEALQVLLGLLRDSGVPQRMVATGGSYQQSLPQGKTYQLMRVRFDDGGHLVPEISGHRLLISIRFMRPDAEGRLRPAGVDTPFELTLCA
jgi:cell division protein ZapD